jgi:hypothetical protein
MSVPDGPQGYALHVSGDVRRPGTVTSAGGAGAAFPAAAFLAANLPNPFSERTAIRFGVPRAGPVTLSVHDVAGRLVRTLMQRELAPGEYVSSWDGRDSGGEAVASGIYFARLRAGGSEETRKMLLLR